MKIFFFSFLFFVFPHYKSFVFFFLCFSHFLLVPKINTSRLISPINSSSFSFFFFPFVSNKLRKNGTISSSFNINSSSSSSSFSSPLSSLFCPLAFVGTPRGMNVLVRNGWSSRGGRSWRSGGKEEERGRCRAFGGRGERRLGIEFAVDKKNKGEGYKRLFNTCNTWKSKTSASEKPSTYLSFSSIESSPSPPPPPLSDLISQNVVPKEREEEGGSGREEKGKQIVSTNEEKEGGRLIEWFDEWTEGMDFHFLPVVLDEMSVDPSPLQIGYEDEVKFSGKNVGAIFEKLIMRVSPNRNFGRKRKKKTAELPPTPLPPGHEDSSSRMRDTSNTNSNSTTTSYDQNESDKMEVFGISFIHPRSGEMLPIAVFAEVLEKTSTTENLLAVKVRVRGRLSVHAVKSQNPFIIANVTRREDEEGLRDRSTANKIADEVVRLHGQCNEFEIEVMEKCGRVFSAMSIRLRPKLGDVLDERLANFGQTDPSSLTEQQAFVQLVSFQAEDYHLTTGEKYNTIMIRNTEDRLRFVRDRLREKQKQLSILRKTPADKLEETIEKLQKEMEEKSQREGADRRRMTNGGNEEMDKYETSLRIPS